MISLLRCCSNHDVALWVVPEPLAELFIKLEKKGRHVSIVFASCGSKQKWFVKAEIRCVVHHSGTADIYDAKDALCAYHGV